MHESDPLATLGPWRRHRRRIAVGALLMLMIGGCARTVDRVVANAISAPAGEVRARHGAEPAPDDPQTLMTRRTPVREGDSARADRTAAQLRANIVQFRDVQRAVAAGYRPFPAEPPPEMRVIHYTHRERSRREMKRLDPAEPGALLYERTRAGTLQLVGAMYTAPVDASLADLDARSPLSLTSWHLHQHVCVPRPLWNKAQWARTLPGPRPLFGPGSPIVTEAACDAVGGRFLPTLFGWMVHVNVFESESGDAGHAMHGQAVMGGAAPPRDLP